MRVITSPIERVVAVTTLSRGAALAEELRRAEERINYRSAGLPVEITNFEVNLGRMGSATVVKAEIVGQQCDTNYHLKASLVNQNCAGQMHIEYSSKGGTQSVRFFNTNGEEFAYRRDNSGYYQLTG